MSGRSLKFIGRTLMLALVAGLLNLMPALVAPATAADRSPQEVTSRPDRVSAMVAARVQGSQVEDESARTPTTATFANPDGTWSVEAHSGVVRSKTDAGEWVPVDARVELVGENFEPRATPFEAVFSDGGDRTVGSVATGENSSVAVRWPSKLPAPVAQGATLRYPDAAPGGGDLVVGSMPNGFSYSVVLDEAPAVDSAPLEYRIPLQLDGLDAKVNGDGSVVLRDEGGRVATMTAPVMWDAANESVDGERLPVATRVEGEDSSRTLVLRPDMDFLTDPTTVYPVTVDPTVTLNVAYDTWVDSLSPSGSQITSPELRVGSTSLGLSKSRSYLYFDFTSLAGLPPAVVSSAELQVTNFDTGSCSGSAVRMSQVTGSYNIATMTWGSQPPTTSAGSATSTASYGKTACPGEGVMSFDATAIVSSWFSGSFNWGVQLKADSETNAAGFRKVRSAENGDPAKSPKLVLTFNSYPSKPTGTSTSPGSTYGSTTYVTSTTPTVSTVVSDPDGGALRGFFEVYNAAGTTLLWSGTSDWATSGARVTRTIPSGVMANGTTYKIAAYSQDATLKSQSAQFKDVTVDTSVPSTTITATNYSNNTWTNPMPGSNTFTFNGPNDTATFDAMLDGVPTTLPANGSGDFSFPYAYVAEWHVFEVAAVDKAGNRGPTTTFRFGSGAPGFTTPKQNGVTTSVFPLDVSAQPTSNGATVSWKLDGETSWREATAITKAGAAWSGTVSTSGGRSTTGQLLWDAAAEEVSAGVSLEAPALIRLRACFHYTSAADQCTYQRTLQLVPSAFGGNFPTAELGPATVALHTGEAMISDLDAADSKAGIGRSFSSYDAATLNEGLFGPGWSDVAVPTSSNADTSAKVIDNRTKDGSFVVVYPDSGSQTFTLDTGTTYRPLVATGDETRLVFTAGTGGNPDSLELFRPLGTGAVTSTWQLKTSDTGGDLAWTPTATDAPGTQGDLAITSDHQRPTFIRESDPSAAATCTAATQTVGCRALALTYTGTGAGTRVASISRVIGAATPGAVQTKTVATYTYVSGKLSTVCSAIPAAGKPALCTGYAYSNVAGRTLLSELTPPGLKKWRFSYDTSGRLVNVKRERPAGGDSTWSIDYTLTPASGGLPNLGATAAAEWGQTTVPTKVYAVYEPYTGAASVTKANLYYATADGTVTNTATYGPSSWLVDTTWFNEDGNQVRNLDGAGWARVQAAASADRPAVAAAASSYTLYNTWGDSDTVGTLVVDEYGPAHTATLKNGTVGLFRTHSHTMYDNDPGVDSALIATRPGTEGLSLAVKTTESTSNEAMTADYDAVHTKYGYDPIVTGDGNGWVLGAPTKVSQQLGSGWSDSITRYDSSGRTIETRQPGGSAAGSGAGNDAHSTVTTYYTAVGSGDCGGKPAWDGLVCKVGPAAQPGGATIPVAYTSSYHATLQPATVQEISGGTLTRTTATTFDELGRVTGVSKATSGPAVSNETIATSYGYADDTGLPTTTGSSGNTVSTSYDTWGRTIGYVDALGTSSATTYDSAGSEATFNDGTATYAYSYGTQGELTAVDAGGGVGSFQYAYGASGNVASVTYPNGMVGARTYDETGNLTGLTYAQGTTTLLTFTVARLADGRVVADSSPASSRRFTMDDLGRLSTVEDNRSAGCTTRTYGFDTSSNRSSAASYSPGTSGGCQTATAATSKTNSYDAAGRITNTGYTYDTLGRTLTVPQVDAGPAAAGSLSLSYRANDMAGSMSQSVHNEAGGTDAVSMTYGLDPAGRFNSIVTTRNGSETERLRYRFADRSDRAAIIDTSVNGGSTWLSARYVSVPALGLAASTGSGSSALHLVNPLGDLVAQMPTVTGSTAVTEYGSSDEFGRSDDAPDLRFRWLGAHQRSSDALGGFVLMGARVYNPSVGMFLQTDPVQNGGATSFSYPFDPVNMDDLSGEWWGIRYTSKRTWYSLPWDFWDAGHHWWTKAGGKLLIGITKTARDAIVWAGKHWYTDYTVGVLFASIASAVASRGKWVLSFAIAGLFAWRWSRIKEVANDAQRKGRNMRITFYWWTDAGPFFVNAWLD